LRLNGYTGQFWKGRQMSDVPHIMKNPRIAKFARLSRRGACYGVLAICVYVFIHAAIEPFHIPSGSMAPALLGHHRVVACPDCGQRTAVGRVAADVNDKPEPRFYRKAFCQNCGYFPLPVAEAPVVAGDKIVVNKTAYWWRQPERWEIVIFRFLGTYFIKRVLGLPGEQVLIHDGDLYVNGQLQRKSLAETRSMALLVFDLELAPKRGWTERWESSANFGWDKRILLDGRKSPCLASYRNYLVEARKCEPLRDEYAYNAGLHADSECVRDFMVETEVMIQEGRGALALRLCDGHDWVEVLLPVGESNPVELFAWPVEHAERMAKLAETRDFSALNTGRHKVEFAFVDRRATLAVDGRTWLSADLPAAKKRAGVERPFQVQADGVLASLERFKLFRDVHYGQQGNNGVRGNAVLLGSNQYFMLGDNSPNSEDSRFWPDEGRVSGSLLVGSLLFVRNAGASR
jgi:signal peptidase I